MFIRADGNETIGLGHIVRCTALAEMLLPEYETQFICKNSSEVALSMITQSGFRYIQINDERSFFSMLSNESTVVTDGYDFDGTYFNQIVDTGAKLICIDDMANTYYPAHLIINQNPAFKESDYHAAPYTKFAIGLEYALLRKPFREANAAHKRATKNGKYLIAMGGVDPLDLSKKILDALLQSIAPSEITLLISQSKSQTYQNNYPFIQVVHSLTAAQMCNLMLNHQYLVCPASSVSIEGLCLGMELFCGYYADNQRLFYEYLVSNKTIHPLNQFEINLKQVHTNNEYSLMNCDFHFENFKTLLNSII